MLIAASLGISLAAGPAFAAPTSLVTAAATTVTAQAATHLGQTTTPPTEEPAEPLSAEAAEILKTNGAASQEAAAAGEPVEIEEFTTETSRTMAFPDGTYELTASRSPVRVKQDGQWRDIDTTLVLRDGVIAPAAAIGGVKFSTGGSAPMVTLDADVTDETGTTPSAPGTVSISWEGDLPAPKLDGSTATYADVRPGVDLVLTAQPSGYAQTLVIADKAAAEAIITDPVELTAATESLTFTVTDEGHTSVTHEANPGTVVFGGAAPVLWDSQTSNGDGGTDPTPTATDPANGKILPADADLTVSQTGDAMDVALAPPAEVLTDSSLVYPLHLDPRLERNKYHYLTVHSRGWNYYDDSTEPMRVGYCGWDECNPSVQGTARSYFSFQAPGLFVDGLDPTIYDAAVRVFQIYGATPESHSVQLHRAEGFLASTEWPGPLGTHLQSVSAAGGSSADPKMLMFNNQNVIDYIKSEAGTEDQNIQFGLRAPEETTDDRRFWKKFSNSPTLAVRYGYPPTTPTNLSISGSTQCDGQPRYADITSDTYVTARSDEQSYQNLGLLYDFELYKWPGTADQTLVRKNETLISGTSGTTVSWQPASANSNSQTLISDGTYAYRARSYVNDPETTNTASAWSSSFHFTVDTTDPAVPTIVSHDYPASYWGAADNTTGTFALKTSSDAAAFTYAFDTGTPPIPNNTACTYTPANGAMSGYLTASSGSATLTPPASLGAGTHTLKVAAFDHAHNTTSFKTYTFMIAPTISGVPTERTKNRIEFTNGAPAANGTSIALASDTDVANDPADYVKDVPADRYRNDNLTIASDGSFARIMANRGTTADPEASTYKFTVPVDGHYALGAQLITANHFGQVRLTLDDPDENSDLERISFRESDRSDPLTINTFATATGTTYAKLGDYLPDARGVLLNANTTYTLTVEIVGTTGVDYTYTDGFHDYGYTVGLDYLTLAPLRLAPFASLRDAFDNTAIGTSSATDFDLIAPTSAAPDTSMAASALPAGLTYPTSGTSTFTTPSGTAFPIPAKRASTSPTGRTYDNVISNGQTIAYSAGSQPTGDVYLLAAATCGPIAPSTARALSVVVNYDEDPIEDPGAEPVDSDHILGVEIPSWDSAAAEPSGEIANKTAIRIVETITMPQRYNGTTLENTPSTFYVLKAPAQADLASMPITSITLPRIGTSFTSKSCSDGGAQALHIFSMTTTSAQP